MGVESACSLLPDGERKQHETSSPQLGWAGLESSVGQGGFLSSSVSFRRGVSDGLGVGGDESPAHHHKALHWGAGGFSCALCTFAAAEGRPGSLCRGGASPQPPDHCDMRAGICRHRGDRG